MSLRMFARIARVILLRVAHPGRKRVLMFTLHSLRRAHAAQRIIAATAALALAASLVMVPVPARAQAAQSDIPGPAGSGTFGASVTVLPNGNFVVTDPGFDAAGATDAGAAYLYAGGSLQLIGTLKGGQAEQRVGGGVTVLADGDFLVRGTGDGGDALTWGDGASGFGAPVVVASAANSLTGINAGRACDSPHHPCRGYEIVPLPNGNFVVNQHDWHGREGAATFGKGDGSTVGIVSAANSLVRTRVLEEGGAGITVLPNGAYLVRNPSWNVFQGYVAWGSATTGVVGEVSEANSFVGQCFYGELTLEAVLPNGNYLMASLECWGTRGVLTWADGATGITGQPTAANSLFGSEINGVSVYDLHQVVPLPNGNYVALSPGWDDGSIVDAGAITWGDGNAAITGTVGITNSLVGGAAGDQVGSGGVRALPNGNYVVASPLADNGGAADAGAVTWADGSRAVTGTVSAANSLMGSAAGDGVGGVTTLANDNYVVSCPLWDYGSIADAGAATWGDGTAGITGTITLSNSLVGGMANDRVGSKGVSPLAGGNYVVHSPQWDNGGAADAGAVTWGDGTVGTAGLVSAANSLVGGSAGDRVGDRYAVVLSGGGYVVSTPTWDGGAAVDAGAVTFGGAAGGVSGAVSSANSLVGSSAGDQVGGEYVFALPNGSYVAASPLWDNGSTADAGAVTWGDGAAGVAGPVLPANSLVGSTAGDKVGQGALTEHNLTLLADGDYVVTSPAWDNEAAADAGAVTWGSGAGGTAGAITVLNSLVGVTAGEQVGYRSGGPGVLALPNGNYAVPTPGWDEGGAADVGAVAWGNGAGGTAGVVNQFNSLVGVEAGQGQGLGLWALENGDYVVRNGAWEEGVVAFTLSNGTLGATVGPVNGANSVLADVTPQPVLPVVYDAVYDTLLVGRPNENLVTVVRLVRPIMLMNLNARLMNSDQ
jgi:hypothetical protein